MPAGMIQSVWFGTTEDGTFGRLKGEPAYVHQPYPSMRYKGEVEPYEKTVVKNEAEDAALGAEWRHSPDPNAIEPPKSNELEEFRAWKAQQAEESLSNVEVVDTGVNGVRVSLSDASLQGGNTAKVSPKGKRLGRPPKSA